ncbi:MAG: hypothetical protein M1833_004779 [Piccolia ochrophora]|nr:MAG: hypothetical protein M1833_004779 [Piccolia ochrophora]
MSSRRLLSKIHWALLCHLVILYGLVSGAVYAGTSALLASYLAGGLISWWDSLSSQKDIPSHGFNSPGATALSNGLGQVRHEDSATRDLPHQGIDPAPKTCSNTEAKAGTTDVDALLHEKQQIISKNEASGARVHEKYLFPVVQRILKPFFFASIGFSIPITRMFSGAIIWRGLVYAILMAFAKLVTGLWLAPSSTRLSFPPLLSNAISQLWRSIQARRGLFPVMKYPLTCWKWTSRKEPASCSNKNNVRPGGPERPVEQAKGSEVQDESGKPLPQPPEETIGPSPGTTVHLSKHADVPQHRSLYPVTVVGAAMVARGEIGFFIASLAEGKGIFISSSEGAEAKGQSSMYLVVVWAISLCTLIGPITAGAIVKRVRRLQAEERNGAGSTDPLGIWGMK